MMLSIGEALEGKTKAYEVDSQRDKNIQVFYAAAPETL